MIHCPSPVRRRRLSGRAGHDLRPVPQSQARVRDRRQQLTHRGQRSIASKPSGPTSCSYTCHSTPPGSTRSGSSVIQRKALSPHDFPSLQAIVHRLDAFEHHYNQIAQPFDWNFTREDLIELMHRLETETEAAPAAIAA